jgi:hypothetical protein
MRETTNAAVNAACAATNVSKNAEREPIKFVRRIGSTVYETTVHFSSTNQEKLEDKILRLIRRDCISNTYETRSNRIKRKVPQTLMTAELRRQL